MFSKNQIGTNLVRTTLSIYFLCIVGLFFIEIFLEYRSNKDDFEKGILSYKETFELPLSKALYNLDHLQIKSIAYGILKSQSIHGVVVISDSENYVDIWKNEESKETRKSFPWLEFELQNPQPQIDNKPMGKVILYYDTTPIIESTKVAGARILFFLILKTLLITLIIFYVTKKILAEPLNQLADKVKDISLESITNRQTISTFKSKRHDEFGMLETSFEKMIRHIQIEHRNVQVATTNLATLNKNLEREVQVRADELKREVAKSISNNKFAALSQMAGGIAHEVNNPLAIIIGRFSQLKRLQKRNEMDGEKVSHIFESISIGVDRITQVVERLRYITSIDNKDDLEASEIQKILWQVCESGNATYNRKGIKISFHQGGQCLVQTKPNELTRVLNIILENSMEALEGSQDKWIKIQTEEYNDFVQIQIIDNGCGIAAEIRDKIFQPFFTTKQIGDGPGIGLSIAKSIILSHGGRLYFDFSKNLSTACIELKKSS